MDWDENKVRPFEYVIVIAKAEAKKQRFVQSGKDPEIKNLQYTMIGD